MLTAHNWQKWKRIFLKCHFYKISRVEAIDLKLYFKKYEYVRFGAVSWKIDNLSITAYSKLESKNPFAHMWPIWVWLTTAHHISFCLINFQLAFQIMQTVWILLLSTDHHLLASIALALLTLWMSLKVSWMTFQSSPGKCFCWVISMCIGMSLLNQKTIFWNHLIS